MVEATQAFDALRHKLLDEVHLSDDRWVPQPAHDVDDDSLQVVRVHEQLLGGDLVAAPEQVNLLTHLSSAAIIYPLQFAHGALQERELLQIGYCQTVGLSVVGVRKL